MVEERGQIRSRGRDEASVLRGRERLPKIRALEGPSDTFGPPARRLLDANAGRWQEGRKVRRLPGEGRRVAFPRPRPVRFATVLNWARPKRVPSPRRGDSRRYGLCRRDCPGFEVRARAVL